MYLGGGNTARGHQHGVPSPHLPLLLQPSRDTGDHPLHPWQRSSRITCLLPRLHMLRLHTLQPHLQPHLGSSCDRSKSWRRIPHGKNSVEPRAHRVPPMPRPGKRPASGKKTSGSNGKSIRRSVSCRSQRPYHCHKVSSRNPSTPNKSRLPRQQRGNDWFGGHEHQPSRPFRADSRSNTCAQAWCDHRQTCVFSSARHFQHRQRRFGRSLARGNDNAERGYVAARHVEV